MKRLTVLVTSAILLSWSGCIIIDDDSPPFANCLDGRGRIIPAIYELSPFDEIELSGDVEVVLVQGPIPSVELRAYENLVDEVRLQVSGDRLLISTRTCINPQDQPKLFITNPDFERISNAGATNILGENTFVINNIKINNFGSGDIDLGLLADAIDILLTGSGNVLLEGESGLLDLDITGSGDFRGFSLVNQQAEVLITGSGDAEVFVENFLKATITGSGNIFFKGRPTLDINITGSGKVVDSN